MSIAAEMQEMICGAKWSRSQVMAAFERLARQRQQVERTALFSDFIATHREAVKMLLDRLLNG
eukprot:SAG11_NODE_1299_length_5264_cov_5.517715_6_plen_63_part_00